MRVAVVQFAPLLGRLEPNLERVLAAAREAHAAGADLLVAPEMSLTGWTLRDEATRVGLAHEVEEFVLPELSRAAAEMHMTIIVGGPVSVDAGSGPAVSERPLANAAILLAPDGWRTVYHKIHLFDEERGWWVSGREAVVALAGGVYVGLTICYDGEFPEVPRMTRLAGAELIAIPATNMTPYEHDQDVIFATRAIENDCPVIVANRVGRENHWNYFGRSLVVDQRGRTIAQAGSGEELLIADIEPAVPGDLALSYLARRRPEVYGPLVEETPFSSTAAIKTS